MVILKKKIKYHIDLAFANTKQGPKNYGSIKNVVLLIKKGD